jgi:hypothetical protein
MAGQDANTVAITGGAIDGTTVGNGTPAAGTFTTLIGGKDAANYGQLTGGATTKAVQFQTLGTDTNISMALQPKGTGAIDLAAGSSGVNISNGGTVTALTRTAAGSGYTSLPAINVSPPTTAGGVTATATASGLALIGLPAVVFGGTGYTVGDTLTLAGFTGTAPTFTVATVSAGVVTAITSTSGGNFTAAPASPASVTGGTGSGATISFSAGVLTTFTITTAGSGYVEQPTVTFSGGGGSGAAAYATVGSGTVVRSLGGFSDITVDTTPILHLRAKNTSGGNPTNTTSAFGFIPPQSNFGAPVFGFVTAPYIAWGGTNAAIFTSNATNPQTSGNTGSNQFAIAHTASAVNYVQVTGGSTGNIPVISAQGSDSNVSLSFSTKSSGIIYFIQSGANPSFRVTTGAVSNYLDVKGAAAASPPVLSALGSDTDIDLALTPKGAGNVRFATYTAGIIAQAGYITIKDSGGTVRRLLVG